MLHLVSKIELLKAETALSKPLSRKRKKDKRDSSSTSSSFVPDEGEREEGSSEEEEFAMEDVEDDQVFVKPQAVTRKQRGEEGKRQSFGRAAAPSIQPTYVTMSGRISHTHQSSTAAKSPMNESSADEYTQSSRSVALLGSLQSAAAASRLSSGDRADASSLTFTTRKRPASSLTGSPAGNRTKRSASTNQAKKQSTSSKSSPLQKGKQPSSSNSKNAGASSIKPSASTLKKGTTVSKSKSAPNSPQGKSKRLSKVSSSKDVSTVIPATLPAKKAQRNAKSAPASAYSSPNNSSKNKSLKPHSSSTSPSFSSLKNKKNKHVDQAMDVDSLPSMQKVKAEEAKKIPPVPKQSTTEKPAGSTTCGNHHLIIRVRKKASLLFPNTLYVF